MSKGTGTGTFAYTCEECPGAVRLERLVGDESKAVIVGYTGYENNPETREFYTPVRVARDGGMLPYAPLAWHTEDHNAAWERLLQDSSPAPRSWDDWTGMEPGVGPELPAPGGAGE